MRRKDDFQESKDEIAPPPAQSKEMERIHREEVISRWQGHPWNKDADENWARRKHNAELRDLLSSDSIDREEIEEGKNAASSSRDGSITRMSQRAS
jgi:hypothetical protein